MGLPGRPRARLSKTESRNLWAFAASIYVHDFYPRTNTRHGGVGCALGGISRHLGLIYQVARPICLIFHPISQVFRAVRLFLHSIPQILHSVSLILRLSGQFVSVAAPIYYLVQREAAYKSQNDSENRNPDGSISGSPSRFFLGCLSFILGAALMKFAFYIADAPYGSNTWEWRSLYLGCGLCAAVCLFFSVWIFPDMIRASIRHTKNVSQKLLPPAVFSYYNNYMANVSLPTSKSRSSLPSAKVRASAQSSASRGFTGHDHAAWREGRAGLHGPDGRQDAESRLPRLEMDEIWGYVGKKEKQFAPATIRSSATSGRSAPSTPIRSWFPPSMCPVIAT